MFLPDLKPRCYIGYSAEDREKAKSISEYLGKEGIDAILREEEYQPDLSAHENLQYALEKADFVILLVPSKTKENENFFFEIGLIIGMGKPLFALVETNTQTRLPSDLSDIMYLTYDSENMRENLNRIKYWARHSFQNSF